MVGDVPGEKPIHLFGRSRIIGPDGKVEAEAPYVAPGERAESSVLVKKLELRKRFEEARAEYGNLLRDRRPELYSLLSTNVEHIESDRKVSR
jgi:predicted amidohydrolase